MMNGALDSYGLPMSVVPEMAYYAMPPSVQSYNQDPYRQPSHYTATPTSASYGCAPGYSFPYYSPADLPPSETASLGSFQSQSSSGSYSALPLPQSSPDGSVPSSRRVTPPTPLMPPTPISADTARPTSYVHNPYAPVVEPPQPQPSYFLLPQPAHPANPSSYCYEECHPHVAKPQLMSFLPTHPPVPPSQQHSSHHQAPSSYPTASQRQPHGRTLAIEKPSRINPQQFEQIIGSMNEMARTPHGSSYIQACLRDQNQERYRAVCEEILPHVTSLLLDTHGCYVVRTLMEQMTQQDLTGFVHMLVKEENTIFGLCTSSLHSRRIVQFFLDRLDQAQSDLLIEVIVRRCHEVARTQQGCIAIQRVLEVASPERRDQIHDLVQRNIVSYAMDPYANYVAQYMFENGDKERNSECVKEFFVGSTLQLATDKYASNVVEKALHFTTPEAQHCIVTELYGVDPEHLIALIQDSYGNYIIQATITLCCHRDVANIAEKLSPVLSQTPYGHKIASKLERRLKGKTVHPVVPMAT